MNSKTEHLVVRLKQTQKALRSFLVFTRQIRDWEQDLDMLACLPDLYQRREDVFDEYIDANGFWEPLIPHDEINLDKLEAVTFLLEIELADGIEEALNMLSEEFD